MELEERKKIEGRGEEREHILGWAEGRRENGERGKGKGVGGRGVEGNRG